MRMFLGFIVIAFMMGGWLAWSLKSGKAAVSGLAGTRDDSPFRYWFICGWLAFMALMGLFGAVETFPLH